MNVNDFFTNGVFNPQLLPTLRPDLAVLLQEDLFNTDIARLMLPIRGRVDGEWQASLASLLQLPVQISHWRSIIWDVLGESIYQWVQSFTELATAMHSFSTTQSLDSPAIISQDTRISPTLAGYLRTARSDDEMRQFLISSLEYLNSIAQKDIEVPVSIIRALNDIERIAQIEESALSQEEQDVIRYCTLQIARLTGESG